MKRYKSEIKVVNMLLNSLGQLKLTKLRNIRDELTDLSARCLTISYSSDSFANAVNRKWLASAEKNRLKLARDINEFSYSLGRFKAIISAEQIVQQSPGEIFADLLQLQQEFGDIKIDLKANTISITTDPIVIEGIELGSFEIKLFIDELDRLYIDRPYIVTALEPNPAGTDSDVTHPHVSHEKLCEGDGHILIERALEQGRICDFFTLIVSILQTYNPDSPYVSIEDWCGVSCYSCGYSVANDERYYCEFCDNDFCPSCSSYCQKCETTICLGCAYECPHCSEPVCGDCTAICNMCDRKFCKDCLCEGLCQDCQEQRKVDEDYDYQCQKETETDLQPDSKVRPESLGQAGVHAGHDR